MTMQPMPMPPGTTGQGSGKRRSPGGARVRGVLGLVVAGLLAIAGGFAAARSLGNGSASADQTADVVTTGDGTPRSSSSTSTSTSTSASTSTSTLPAPSVISPVGATASNVRESVDRLRCGGRSDFFAGYLIDGDPQTGWGAANGDGTGQSVTVDLGATYNLQEVGITPGYLKVAPRSDQGCSAVSAFRFNRRVSAVRYAFDDGTAVEQTLGTSEAFEMVQVSARTQFVTITILGTESWGSDDDTIISDARFLGSPA
jgi:hypothetical protein